MYNKGDMYKLYSGGDGMNIVHVSVAGLETGLGVQTTFCRSQF